MPTGRAFPASSSSVGSDSMERDTSQTDRSSLFVLFPVSNPRDPAMVALEIGLPSGTPATLAGVVGQLCGAPVGSGRALTPLSILAWTADQFAYGEWIQRSGFADFPWTLSS